MGDMEIMESKKIYINDNWKQNRIKSCKDGTNPTFITELKSRFVVIGDTQFLPGYCVLLYKDNISSLNDLDTEERKQFLIDMTLVGNAIKKVYNPLKINYEILGNLDEFVHAHIFPRYEWEGETVKHSIRRYPKEKFTDESNQFMNLDNREQIINNLKEELDKLKI